MSSKRRIRARVCGDNIRYDSQTNAVASLLNLNKKQPGSYVSAYKCRFCGHWHLGHTPKSVWKRAKEREG